MSYAWHLSRGDNTNDGAKKSTKQDQQLGSAAVETPLTPPSVRNVTPSICMSIVQFRALLQEYRSLDDSVTTRLNRSVAQSRATGYTASPSILSGHVESSSSKDLGKSTYATAPEHACLAFWRELVSVWLGREEVLQYCLKIEQRNGSQARIPPTSGSSNVNEEWLINGDVDKERREAELKSSWLPGSKKKATYDAFDSRSSRSEDTSDALRRHLKNELSVEAIIRKRSLDVFKSRCRYFVPSFSADHQGEQEKAMWEGRETQAGQEARR